MILCICLTRWESVKSCLVPVFPAVIMWSAAALCHILHIQIQWNTHNKIQCKQAMCSWLLPQMKTGLNQTCNLQHDAFQSCGVASHSLKTNFWSWSSQESLFNCVCVSVSSVLRPGRGLWMGLRRQWPHGSCMSSSRREGWPSQTASNVALRKVPEKIKMLVVTVYWLHS